MIIYKKYITIKAKDIEDKIKTIYCRITKNVDDIIIKHIETDNSIDYL